MQVEKNSIWTLEFRFTKIQTWFHKILIVAYNCQKKGQLKVIQKYFYEFCSNTTQENTDRTSYFLVGCQSDLVDNDSFEDVNELSEFININQFNHFRTSAKNGSGIYKVHLQAFPTNIQVHFGFAKQETEGFNKEDGLSFYVT